MSQGSRPNTGSAATYSLRRQDRAFTLINVFPESKLPPGRICVLALTYSASLSGFCEGKGNQAALDRDSGRGERPGPAAAWASRHKGCPGHCDHHICGPTCTATRIQGTGATYTGQKTLERKPRSIPNVLVAVVGVPTSSHPILPPSPDGSPLRITWTLRWFTYVLINY